MLNAAVLLLVLILLHSIRSSFPPQHFPCLSLEFLLFPVVRITPAKGRRALSCYTLHPAGSHSLLCLKSSDKRRYKYKRKGLVEKKWKGAISVILLWSTESTGILSWSRSSITLASGMLITFLEGRGCWLILQLAKSSENKLAAVCSVAMQYF